MPIYDRSYRRWDGELKKRALRFLPIAGTGIRMAVRTKRTILWTIVFYLFLMASSAPFLILLLFNYLFYFPPAALQATDLSTFLDQIAPYRVLEYLSYHRLMDLAGFHLIFVALFGANLVSRDRAAMALPLYLSRPLRTWDYILGKFAIVAFFMSCITLFPCLALWLLDALANEDEGHFAEVLPHLWAILAHSGSLVVVYSLTILAVSSLCKRPMTAAVVWIGTFWMLRFVILILTEGMDIEGVAAVFPAHATQSIGYAMLDVEGLVEALPGATQFLRGLGLKQHASVGASVASLVGWSALSVLVIVRSITRVDVTSSQGS